MATNPLPPIAIGLRQRRDAKNRPSSSDCANGAMRKKPPKSGCLPHHHPIAPTAQCEKNRRRAVSYVSTGLARLPRDTNARTTTAEERLYMSSPRLANLYNRSSAVDPSLYNQPQVGKPTWGYDYTTALRRLPSDLIICLRQRRNAEKTAEERFNMLARGWLAYPVTPIHSQLPPKSGCRNVILAKLPYETHLLNWACPNSTNLPHLPD